MWDYQAKVEQVTDGDTIRLTIDHGMYLRSSSAIRLLGVYAPERSQTGGPETTLFVKTWVEDHRHIKADGRPGPEWPLHVITQKDKQTFNRYLGVITCATCGDSLNVDVTAYVRASGWSGGTGA